MKQLYLKSYLRKLTHYYTKLKRVIESSLMNYECFSLQEISRIASENMMCPFELSLDLSLFVDVIVCDYNYMFDPQVFLQRYFLEDRSKTLVLVDEANNLVDRGRDMYSCSFSYESFKKAKSLVDLAIRKKLPDTPKEWELVCLMRITNNNTYYNNIFISRFKKKS